MAVNSAGRNRQDTPLREAMGRVSSPAPRRIMKRNTRAMVFVGESFHCFRAE